MTAHPSLPNPQIIAPDDMRRRTALTGTYNFRDVGGYPTSDGRRTRWHVLFRSDGLGSLSTADQQILQDWGIQTIIDLRDDEESQPAPDAVQGMALRHLSIPVFENTLFKISPKDFPPLSEHYIKIIREHSHQLAAAVGALGDEQGLPAIVHCTAGKDRTGLVIALTLALLGVRDEWIVQDYEASQRILGEDFVKKVTALYQEAGFSSSMLEHPTISPASYLISALKAIREQHQSIEAFLRFHGVSAEALMRIRQRLLTD